ncbi:Protein of unknown function [Micromonospora lupini str. Lupac 08]|uniref:Uncharacterized protein n=1 Tax=Micromonospora lupini str. Lupac 08 TaxID=1150864 RepID=I0L784_9ACTN|nr:Protein of unknown function [Micromonospora lupini str. Lupac 08]
MRRTGRPGFSAVVEGPDVGAPDNSVRDMVIRSD